MEQYIGTKIIEAQPCPAWKDAGGHKAGDPGYRVRYSDGYESWSPKDVFEAAYRRTKSINFGLAIEAAKAGKKIQRAGWNGKDMWVVYRAGYPDGVPCNKNTSEAVGIPEGTLFRVQPYLQMKCADGSFQMWVANQADILADDWRIVE